MADQNRDALTAVRSLHSAIEELLDAAAATYAINRTDLRCLEILDRQGPMTAGQLAARGQISPAGVTKLLQRLQRSGFVTVQNPPTDHRQQIASTSDRHQDLRSAVWGPVVQRAEAIFGSATEHDQRQLVSTLQALAEVAHDHAARLATSPRTAGCLRDDRF